MSRTEVFITIVAPAAIAEQCRQLAANWPGGVGMFTTPLSANGSQVPTHYISTGHIDSTVVDMLNDPALFATETGIDPADAEGLRSNLIISDRKDVHVWLAELGLSLMSTEEPL